MLASKDIQTLTSRPERADNSVLTFYLNVDQAQETNRNRGFENYLKEMLVALRNTIRDEKEVTAFQTASQRVSELVAGYEIGARGLVGAFDTSDAFLWREEVDFPLANCVRWGRGVFLQPLATAFQEYERVGIVLLDRASLRLFTMFLGDLQEHVREQFDHRKVRHTKTVGMDHLGSASRAQHRADEVTRLNLRHITKDIDSMLSEHEVGRIILAGGPDITAELQSYLPKRINSRIIGKVDLPMRAALDEIRNLTLPVVQEYQRETEETVVNDLVTSAAKAGRAVVGLPDTLGAVNNRRVWELVYAESLHSTGFECTRCRALFSDQPASCTFCGADTSPIDDIVEQAVDHVMRRGAKIGMVRSSEAASSLTNAGGIGAFLRTRTNVRAS